MHALKIAYTKTWNFSLNLKDKYITIAVLARKLLKEM